MDVNLPDIDGNTTHDQIEIHSILPGYPGRGHHGQCNQRRPRKINLAGYDGYIEKPIDIDLFQTRSNNSCNPDGNKITSIREYMTPESRLRILQKQGCVSRRGQCRQLHAPCQIVNALGIQCEWKSSGFEVVEFSKTLTRLDIILLDIHLPYEDGYSALSKIRSAENLKSIPVVAVTADVSTDSMAKAQKAGFNGFLGKPIDPDRFPDQLRRILTGDTVWEMY